MFTRNSIVAVACGLGAAALANCSPYSPDLGAAPYLCAAQEPRCPDDYSCVDDGTGREVCLAAGGAVPDGGVDGGGDGFQCADDGNLEPNDTIANAFATDVGINAAMRIYGPLAICPETDVDLFSISVGTGNPGLEFITRWDSGDPVSVQLLNSVGSELANGTAMGTNARRACATNLPMGTYFAKAFSSASKKNNYRIEIRVVQACN